jgi:hypothetical protein
MEEIILTNVQKLDLVKHQAMEIDRKAMEYQKRYGADTIFDQIGENLSNIQKIIKTPHGHRVELFD